MVIEVGTEPVNVSQSFSDPSEDFFTIIKPTGSNIYRPHEKRGTARLRSFLGFLQTSGRPKRTIAGVLLLATLTACGNARDVTGAGFEHAVVRVAIPRDPATLNPLISETNDELSIEAAVFDGLLKFDAKGQLVPDLATAVPSRANGGITADLKTITYHLRRGVAWQDGSPFTSGDVAFTYRMFVSDRVASPLRSSYVQVASLDTPSPYTVVAHLRKPSFGVISQIFVAGSGFIVPEHILRGVNDIRRSSFNASPVGTGPFAVTRWDRGDDIHLVANDRYFEGRPRVQGLLLRIVPDPVTRAQLATTGAVELASVDQSEVSSLKAVPGIRVVRTLARSVFYLDLNTRRSPLDKRALRRALAAAVDRPRLASILGGGVQAANSLMPGDRRCTKVAGPAEAIRSRGGGPLSVQLTYASGPKMEHLALVLRQAWKSIGVEATLRPLPFALLYGEGGAVAAGRYDVAIDGFGVADPGGIAPLVASESIPPKGFNFSRYADPDVDRWLVMADGTDDERKRARLYAHVQDALCRDVPVIPLFWDTHTYALNTRLHGFAPGPISSDFWNVASWSLQ